MLCANIYFSKPKNRLLLILNTLNKDLKLTKIACQRSLLCAITRGLKVEPSKVGNRVQKVLSARHSVSRLTRSILREDVDGVIVVCRWSAVDLCYDLTGKRV